MSTDPWTRRETRTRTHRTKRYAIAQTISRRYGAGGRMESACVHSAIFWRREVMDGPSLYTEAPVDLPSLMQVADAQLSEAVRIAEDQLASGLI